MKSKIQLIRCSCGNSNIKKINNINGAGEPENGYWYLCQKCSQEVIPQKGCLASRVKLKNSNSMRISMVKRFKFISHKVNDEYFFDVCIDGNIRGRIDMAGYDCATSILEILNEPYDLISD